MSRQASSLQPPSGRFSPVPSPSKKLSTDSLEKLYLLLELGMYCGYSLGLPVCWPARWGASLQPPSGRFSPVPSPSKKLSTDSLEKLYLLLELGMYCGYPSTHLATQGVGQLVGGYNHRVVDSHSAKPQCLSMNSHKKVLCYIITPPLLSPPVHIARWAHMHHFLSVRLSAWTLPKIGENNSSESIGGRNLKLICTAVCKIYELHSNSKNIFGSDVIFRHM